MLGGGDASQKAGSVSDSQLSWGDEYIVFGGDGVPSVESAESRKRKAED